MLLRTAPVQTVLAHQVAKFLSKELRTEVVIGNFRLNWFLEAVITDIKIVDLHNNVLLQSNIIRADVKTIDFSNHKLHLNEILLSGADINLIQYKSDSSLNLQFILDHFASTSADTTPSVPWMLECNNLRIKESHFAFRDERYMSPVKGIDFSDMDFSNLNLEVRNISLHGDSVVADFRQLTCQEKSGFLLDDFSTQAIVCPRGISAEKLRITTGKSRLSLDLKFEFNSFEAFDYFIDSVKITANIEPSQLDMRDIVSFASDVFGMENIIDFSGKVRGTVSSFSAKDFQFSFGNYTEFQGNIQLNGLPDVEETFVNLKIDKLITNVSDIQSFTLPYSDSVNTIILPAQLASLGNVKVNGRFTGFYNDFVSKATFITDVGQLTTDLLLINNKATRNYEYDGKILVESFNAGKVLDIKQIGTLNLYAVVKGQNFSFDKANLTFKGEITDLQYDGNTYGLINVDGEFKHKKFTGGIFINDELLGLDFFGSVDLAGELPAFDFQAGILNANLAKLNLISDDSVAFLTTNTEFKFKGNTLDNLIGALRFTNTSFIKGAKTLNMKELSVVTTSLGSSGKRMQLNSDFANAVFTGQYTFDDMADYLTMVFTDFLPSLAQKETSVERKNIGSFDYTIHLHNTDLLTGMFAPWIKIHTGTVISGSFDPTVKLVNLNGRSPLIVVNGFALRNWSLLGNSADKKLNIRMECSQIDGVADVPAESASKKVEQFKLSATVSDDIVRFGLGWNDLATVDHNKSEISGSLSFKQNPRLIFSLDKADIMINDTLWTAIPGNQLVMDSSYFEAKNFGFVNNHRQMVINGIASHDPLNVLKLNMEGFNLSNLDVLTREIGIDFDGFLNGSVSVSDVYEIPRIVSDITVSKFGFNHENLGDASIKSEWDSRNSLLAVDVQIIYVGNVSTHYPIKVLGNIYPEREHDNFDLNIDVDNLKIKTIEPFLEGVFSRMRGWASGKMTLTGDFSDPVLKGKLDLMRTELLVDYLRTSYSFTGNFNFDKDLMWFKDIVLRDSTFGTGILSGNIHHKAFSDWALDINLKADNLAALNTPYSPVEMYYGRAKATGSMTLKGPVDNLVLKANITSDKGTSVFIPISFSRSISQNSFIRYREKEDSEKHEIQVTPEETSVLSLQLGLDVTRFADIGIILPYQMGTIDVRGSGLINMGIDTRGEYSMFGQYIMDNGNFMFNFENILKKDFAIQKGGLITFNGSPYDSDINLQAVYKVKTSLAGLNVQPEYKGTRVNVDCIINLSNNLYNPDIRFSIALPDASEDMKRQVFSLIDTSNALEMNQQMISLLVLNTFSSSSGISSSGASFGLSSYEILSAQLSSLLSKISKDFDIGVNYRPGDQLTPQELELALSTQLFDNRVTIDGAVGNSYNSSNQTNQFIGDVLVEVKITEDGRFRVKGFNRTNSSLELTNGYSPYTQGVGILYRKEFTKFRDLFKSRKTKLAEADSIPAK